MSSVRMLSPKPPVVMPCGLVSQVGCSIPNGCKQPRLQVIEHGRSRHLLHDRREHVGRRRIVEEMGPGLVRDRLRQERLGPRCSFAPCRLGLMARRHAQEVADSHRLQVPARLGGRVSGKYLSTGSLTVSFPSAMAIPTALAVKLLLSE